MHNLSEHFYDQLKLNIYTIRLFIIKAYLFLIPLLSLFNTSAVRYGKIFIIAFVFSILLTTLKFPSKNKLKPFFLLFLLGCTIFAIRNANLHYISIALNYINFYYIFISKNISLSQKKSLFNCFIWGIVVSVIAGCTYMFATGTISYGGDYTENEYGISNLAIPVLSSIVFAYIYFFKVENRIVIYSFKYMILLFFILLLLVFLGKRLPLITIFLSIFYVKLNIKNKIVNFTILFLILIYPFYSIFFFDFLSPISESELFLRIFKRNDDLVNLTQNPRLIRINAAIVMLQNVSLINLFYYPIEIVVSTSDAHNHFHNLLIQVYYERGFISVLSLFLLSLISINKSNNSITQYTKEIKVSLAIIINCFLIGTGESLLYISTLQLYLIFFIIIGYGLTSSDDKNQNLVVLPES